MDDFDFDELTAMAENEGGGGGYEEYEEDEEAEAAMREAEGLPSTAKPAAAVQPAAKAPSVAAAPLPEKSYSFVSPLRRAPISEADEIALALNTEGLRHRLSPQGVAAVKAHRIPDWRARSTAVAAALSAPTAAPLRTAVDQNLAALAGGFSTRSQVICAAADAAAAVLDRPSVETDCIGCVTGDGTKAFLELLPTEELDLEELRRSKARGSSGNSSSTGLLQCPIEELLRRVEVRQIERTSRALAAAAMQQDSTAATAADDEASSATKQQQQQQQQQPREGRLWVDKYAPSGFSQLLSDERINREVLRAVKAWDSFVFGTAATAAAAAASGIENRAGAAAAQSASKKLSSPRGRSAFGSGFGSKYSSSGNKASAAARKSPHKDASDSTSTSGVREDRRPASRVLLLCGPPGMGKTTLAHIVAKQAGYRPLEINASDDRTAAVLKDKVCDDAVCSYWKCRVM
jgi:ATPase family associated with various cellular activities (AAA)